MDYYKICKICGEKKPKKTHFFKDPRMKDGYKNICKSCKGIKENKDPEQEIIPQEILNLMMFHKTEKISYFGYFLGFIIKIRKNEFMAYSVLKGIETAQTHRECKAWLCMQVQKAANIIKRGLTKKLKQLL